MKRTTRFSGARLTLFTPDRQQIVGDLSDAAWEEESSDAGTNFVLSGLASEGTLDTILKLNEMNEDVVAYDFESQEAKYQGMASMLRPVATHHPAGSLIQIETPEAPLELKLSPTQKAELL